MSTDNPPQAPPRRRFPRRLPLVAAVVLALALVLGVLARAWARDTSAQHYVPAAKLESGPEVVFIFVGGSFCLAHRREGFPENVEKAKVALARSTAARRGHFRAVGVALDWNPEEGHRWLRRFGRFDEVSLGSNWVNGAALRYIWRDLPGRPAVPQVVVVERQVEKTELTVNVVNERVVRRLLGVDEIADWAAAGAPLRGHFPRTTRLAPKVDSPAPAPSPARRPADS